MKKKMFGTTVLASVINIILFVAHHHLTSTNHYQSLAMLDCTITHILHSYKYKIIFSFFFLTFEKKIDFNFT